MNGETAAGVLPASSIGDSPGRLGSLFDMHYDRLYRLARRLVPSREDALDLVQETFLRAVRSEQSIPEGGPSEEAWLVRVLINIRRDQWRRASICDRLNKTEPRVNSGQPEAALIARSTVWHALDLLPPRRRGIVVMHELEGMSIPAIASLLGINAITVRWHLSVGKRELTHALKSNLRGSQ